MTQLALETEYMSLDEVVEDHCAAFDDAVWDLEREALAEAARDQEAAAPVEFRPLTVVREPAEGEER